MDSITFILNALMSGISSSPTYQLLKTLIRHKFSGNARAESILAQFEKNPAAWENSLRQELILVGADKDEEIIEAAQAVMQSLEEGKAINSRRPADWSESIVSEQRFFGWDDDLVATETDETFAGAPEVYPTAEPAPPEQPVPERGEVAIGKRPVQAEPASPERPAAEPGKRWINAEIMEHPSTEPLKLNEVYRLAFAVDVIQSATGASSPLDESRLFEPGEEQVELAIHLTSRDFTIYTKNPQMLYLPRSGKSKNKPIFEIEPHKKGTGQVTANFYRNNNFIQALTLTFAVEESQGRTIIDVKTLGRPVDGAFAIQPRDLSLTVTEAGSGYHLLMVAGVSKDDDLAVTKDQLVILLDEVRTVLHDIVYMTAPDNTRVYQTGIAIPPDINEEALRCLAKAGFKLYQKIFYGPSAHAGTRELGDRLREIAEQNVLKIQIVSQQFLIPWGILYVADRFDEEHINPEKFLGLKHIIEHIPVQQTGQLPDYVIKSRPSLNVSLNVNTDIDVQMPMGFVAGQVSYWEKTKQRNPPASVVIRSELHEVTRALASNSTTDQILYFYCHAATDEKKGPDASYLKFSGGKKLLLGDLSVYAPTGVILPGKPLVFINACESAELSPRFYDGFMPYFTARGARGMIGTESEVPAIFAARWAQDFFEYFLQGNKPVGQIFLQLRQDFFYKNNNLLGLLYALYCDADTQIEPGLLVV